MSVRTYPTFLALLVVGVMALASGCGDDEPASGATDGGGKALSVGAQDDFIILNTHVAAEKGFFAKHGVSDVTVTKFTDLPAMTAAISQGQVDLGFQAVPLVHTFNTKSKAAKFKFFAAGVKVLNVFLARKGEGIPVATTADWKSTVRAWEGKTIGVPALGGLIEAYVRYFAKEAGLDPKKLDVVAAGLGPGALAALKAKKVDVVHGDPLTTEQIVSSGTGEVVLDLAKGQGPAILNDTFAAGYFAPEDRLEQDQTTYAGFAAAIKEARAFMLDPANHDEVARILAKVSSLQPGLASAVVQDWVSVFDVDLSPDRLQRTVDAMTQAGALPPPAPSVSELDEDLES